MQRQPSSSGILLSPFCPSFELWLVPLLLHVQLFISCVHKLFPYISSSHPACSGGSIPHQPGLCSVSQPPWPLQKIKNKKNRKAIAKKLIRSYINKLSFYEGALPTSNFREDKVRIRGGDLDMTTKLLSFNILCWRVSNHFSKGVCLKLHCIFSLVVPHFGAFGKSKLLEKA